MNMFALPNGLKIPEDKITMFAEAKTLGRNKHDTELRKSLIREFVRENKGKLISIGDFGIVAYNSITPGAASPMIKKLLREKRLTRTHIRIDGKLGYTYEWHDQRMKDPVRSNGEVKVIVPPREQPQQSDEATGPLEIDNHVFAYLALNPTHAEAVVAFRNYVKEKS